MNDITGLIITAIEKATTGELFDDAETDSGTTAVTIYDSFLKKNAPGYTPKKEHPFILVRPVGCEDAVGKSRIFIPIQCGIHTHENVDSGVADIRRLVELLREGFSDQTQFIPYGLDRIITTLGDPEDGDQYHPKYYANLELTISQQAILNNY